VKGQEIGSRSQGRNKEGDRHSGLSLLIPATRKVEIGGLWLEASLGQKVNKIPSHQISWE
jgi:hypothetical protein